MFNFLKSKKSIESPAPQRVLVFPKEKMKKLAFLLDQYRKDKTVSARLELWLFISEIFPDEKFDKGCWALDTDNACEFTLTKTKD